MVMASSLPHADIPSTSTNDINRAYTLFILLPPDGSRLQSETADFNYFTSSDVVGVWSNLSGETEQIPSENVS